MMLWPLASSLSAALVLIAVAGMADGPALTATFATRQKHTPTQLQGQIFVTAASLKVGALAIGAALAGPVVLELGPRGAILLAATLQLIACASGLVLSRTRERPTPAGVRPSVDLDERDAVRDQRQSEADGPPVEVALDHRATAERARAGAPDPERPG
jgi:hypothetical protein